MTKNGEFTEEEVKELISVREQVNELTDEIMEIDDEIVKILTVEISALIKKRDIIMEEMGIFISRDVEMSLNCGSKFKRKAKILLGKRMSQKLENDKC